MKSIKAIACIVTLLFMACAFQAQAQSTPRWVKKGVQDLNSQRSNDTYEFVKFNTWDLDLEWLKENRTKPIGEYLVANYGAQPASIKYIPVASGPLPSYKVTYTGQDGREYVVDAKLVDEFEEFDDYELNYFQWEFYQLYAISRPNVAPVFDRFDLTRQYNSEALVKSIIPGMGQLYKGQDTKGYVILGSEVFLVGAGLIMDYKRRDCSKMKGEEPMFAGSWHSKELGWRNFEIGAFSAAAAVYIYNLIDAARSKGARKVTVTKAANPYYTLTPYAAPHEAGVCLTVNF